MTPTAKDKSDRRRVIDPVRSPIRVELTNEEILADLLYPVGREQARASLGRIV